MWESIIILMFCLNQYDHNNITFSTCGTAGRIDTSPRISWWAGTEVAYFVSSFRLHFDVTVAIVNIDLIVLTVAFEKNFLHS